MNVLITGGTGFVGSNLVRKLLKRGNRVGIILRKQSNEWRLNDLNDSIIKLYTDLTDKKELNKQISKYKPEIILHTASYGTYPKFQKDLNLMYNTNINGTKNLIEIAKGISIINTGSSSEYGIKNSPMRETDICEPYNDYGKTKLEQTLYCRDNGIPTLRLFSVYGPWEDPNRLIPTLIKAKIKGLSLKLINSVREYAYVEDITNAFLIAKERYDNIKGEIINIGTGKQISMKDVLNTINEIDSRDLKISWDFKQIQREPSIWVADIRKAKKVLEWVPKYNFKKGLKETYNWWKDFLIKNK